MTKDFLTRKSNINFSQERFCFEAYCNGIEVGIKIGYQNRQVYLTLLRQLIMLADAP
jgi:hypothetical protein